jgi:ABC-type nitrate/sulfonate/bicarbonate transport system permease component
VSLNPARLVPKGALAPLGLVAIVELWFLVTGYASDTVAPPSAIVVAGVEALADGSMLQATRHTLGAALAGLAIGGGIGLMLGLLLGTFSALDRLLEVTIESLRPVPAVALIPVGLIVFGFGYQLEIATVAFSCTWPVLLLTRSAIAGVDEGLLDIARMLGLSFVERVGKIVIPATLPRIVVAFRLVTSLALIVAVTTEIAANPYGLGYEMMVAEQSLRPALMLAYLVWIGLIGWLTNKALLAIQRRLLGPAAMVESAP